ncbi:MAG: DUF402 domain-containing protein [Chloroflexota bacterium]|nr:DUF402 domain-containing protein [Chloroflexota bacterium]
MKRKRADRPDCRRVTRRRSSAKYLETADFTGHVALLVIDDVTEPLWIETEHFRVRIADRGFSWLQHFPADARHTLTTMFDADHKVVQWYVDICKGHGVDEQGIPWFDDLYLDIAALPSGEVYLLDADELEEALREGRVSREDYDFAWREARRLLAAIERDELPLLRLSEAHRRALSADWGWAAGRRYAASGR